MATPLFVFTGSTLPAKAAAEVSNATQKILFMPLNDAAGKNIPPRPAASARLTAPAGRCGATGWPAAYPSRKRWTVAKGGPQLELYRRAGVTPKMELTLTAGIATKDH